MRLLSIVHERDAAEGVFGEAIADAGHTLETWFVPGGAEPPADPLGFDAVLVFGGSMNVDEQERHGWLAREKAVLAVLVAARRPLLGVCLGAQLLCEAAGGRAHRASEPEIGWFEVELTAAGADDPLLGPLAPRFEALEWHSYECDVPESATVLARTAVCAQAFRFDTCAWGIQFHAEVTATDIGAWIDDYRVDPDAVRIGLDTEAMRARTAARIEAWNALGRALCGRFVELARSYSPVSGVR